MGAVGTISLRNLNTKAEEMYSTNLQSVNKMLSVKTNMSKIEGKLLTMIYEKDKSRVEEAGKNIASMVQEFKI